MTDRTAPTVDCSHHHTGLPVNDVSQAVALFGHYIYTVGPPVRIERVDVPVRLEKRLAGLLEDLAIRLPRELSFRREVTPGPRLRRFQP